MPVRQMSSEEAAKENEKLQAKLGPLVQKAIEIVIEIIPPEQRQTKFSNGFRDLVSKRLEVLTKKLVAGGDVSARAENSSGSIFSCLISHIFGIYSQMILQKKAWL
jgi:hypothetical protein